MVKYEIPKKINMAAEAIKAMEPKEPPKKEEPEKIITVEESQIEYTEKQGKQFFDEDDEIIEVNWD